MILLFAALLPAIVLLVYVYQKDKVEKEPTRLVVRLFFLGVVAGPLAAIVETMAFSFFESVVPSGVLLLVLEFFVGVAAVEEGFKYLFLSTIRKNPEFNYVFDGIVYAVAVSLGFAALENILYVFDGGLEVALTRAIFSVPGHAADGVVMGCFFGMARQREVAGNKSGARVYYWLAFLLPVAEHGFYDAALSSESEILVLIALGVELAFIVFAMVLVNRISKNDQAIYRNQPQPFAGQQLYPQNPSVQQQWQQPQVPQQFQQQQLMQQQWQQQAPQQFRSQQISQQQVPQQFQPQQMMQQQWQPQVGQQYMPQSPQQQPQQRILTPQQQQYWQQQGMQTWQQPSAIPQTGQSDASGTEQ